jgi:glucose/arabinose dehydrogenase
VLYALVLLVAAAGTIIVIQRNRTPGWFDCTMRQLAEPAAAVENGAEFTTVGLEVVAEVQQALAMDTRPGSPALYVGTKDGRVVKVDGAEATTVVDLTAEVSTTLEQGLLGVAISPDGEYLYVDYTDVDDHTHVVEYRLSDSGEPEPATRREVMFVEQPFHTHNGGHLEFAPDGLLWISLGDGGGSLKGPDHGFGDNAQDGSVLHGSLLRIDPRPSEGQPYAIPEDNPYVDDAAVRDEIWMMGLRNPWRFSLDPETGDLWIGDVGQFCWEEINHLPAAGGAGAATNLGWPVVEGYDEYAGGELGDFTWPSHVVSHENGDRSIVGGIVYRGAAIPELQGWYVWTDTYNGELRALRPNGEGYELRSLGVSRVQPVSFAVDDAGELYVMSFAEGVSKLVPGGSTDG